MDRSNTDPFWNHVVRMDDGSMKCEFCERPFPKGTSISRIKWHLSGEKGRGVAICCQVPNDVQEAAFLAMSGDNKRQKTVASSSNVNDNAISSCPQEENNEVHNLARDVGRIQMAAVQGTERGVGERRTSSRAEVGNLMENMAGEMMHIDRSFTAEGSRGDAHETRGIGVEFSPHTLEEFFMIFPVEMETNEEDRGPGWNIDDAPESGQRIEINEEYRVPGRFMVDAPESGRRIEQVGQVLEQSNGVDNLAGDGGRIQMAVQGTEQGVGEGRTSSRAEAGNLMENMAAEMMHIDTGITAEKLIFYAHGTRGEASQAPDIVGQAIGRSWDEIRNLLMEDDVENVTGGLLQPVVGTSSSVGSLQPVVGSSYSGGFLQPVAVTSSSGGLMQPVVGTSSSGGFLQPVAGTSSSGGCLQPVVGASSSGGSLQPVVGASSSGGSLQPVVGASSSGGSLQPAVGASSSGGSLQPAVGASSSGGFLQPVVGTSSSGGLTHNICETRGDPLPTSSTKIVGQAFEKNEKEIWSWLIDDEVSSVGIYGMGGVGKTRMLQHIHNQLLERLDISHHVYWVTVSRDFSIYRLQNLIAKCLHLDLSNEDDELRRAVKLSKELKKKQKWILILDDLWNYFELHKVGIPVPVEGCKLIVTTRLEKVCQRMDCQKKIKMQPLSKDEAWTLFIEKLGHDIAFSPEVKKIAQSITEECAGLPLGIITMAGTMKGVDDIHEWKNALEDLKESRVRQDDMEEEVFRILRFSYMHLNDLALQQCFLYCALFPEDFKISKNNMIGYLIDEGVIKRMKSREAEFDKGHSMLNTLVNVCLLECGGGYVKMHDLIRDMAIQIQQENFEVMVKAGEQLKELPDAEEWTESLVRVSLMQNQIEEIPSGFSPSCPNLSTLLLCSNENMRFIACSFFKEMRGLKVLDLSHTGIEKLPDSVSDLASLISLLLLNCKNLRRTPSLKSLRALKRLDLSCTPLVEMPQGLECLSNLRYLILSADGQTEFSGGILPKLSQLQVLVLQEAKVESGRLSYVTVKGKEVSCLRKLETLQCHFEHVSEFVEFIKSRDGNQSLSTCTIHAGRVDTIIYETMPCGSKIEFRDCNDAKSLCFLLECATKLKVIRIWNCNSMESLVSSSWFCSDPLPSPSIGTFSSLKQFDCYRCSSVKKLFPLVLLPNLVNLEKIRVALCEKMEEIIATRDEEGVMGEETSCCYSNIELNLPKLRILELANLPELKSICCAKLICDSVQKIKVLNCPSLKKMPICLPSLDNGQPSPPPSHRRMFIYPNEWWESVQWEHPNTKDVLRPFVVFLSRDDSCFN